MKRRITRSRAIIVGLFVVFIIWFDFFNLPWLMHKPAEKIMATQTAWNFGVVLTIKDIISEQYLDHAEHLLGAENDLKHNRDIPDVVAYLNEVPGIDGIIISDKGREEPIVAPTGISDPQAFQKELFSEEAMYVSGTHPIMRRKVGGLTRPRVFRNASDSFDCLVRYFTALDSTQMLVAYVLEREWFKARIPIVLDSMRRERESLLFWSASQPEILKQQVGLTMGADTLWWSGDRTRKAENVQMAGMFDDAFVHVDHQWNVEKRKMKSHLTWTKALLYGSQAVSVVLLLFL